MFIMFIAAKKIETQKTWQTRIQYVAFLKKYPTCFAFKQQKYNEHITKSYPKLTSGYSTTIFRNNLYFFIELNGVFIKNPDAHS